MSLSSASAPTRTAWRPSTSTSAEYEDIRRHPRRFFAALGHEAPVIAAGSAVLVDGRFDNRSVIELIGRAGELAEHDYDKDWG
jgi:hypothetical protein